MCAFHHYSRALLSWSAFGKAARGNPAASVLRAFSKNGLPIGIQIVERNQDDWGVLQMAFAFEQARFANSEIGASKKDLIAPRLTAVRDMVFTKKVLYFCGVGR